MKSILNKLKGGNLRSIGRADEVVKIIIENPSLFEELFEDMLSDDPIIRMRSADVIEKVSAQKPEYLQPCKSRLIKEISKINQREVRWHLTHQASTSLCFLSWGGRPLGVGLLFYSRIEKNPNFPIYRKMKWFCHN